MGYGRKEVLIKAIANSLPTHVMRIFKIPVNFCDELRAMISRFWWAHEEGKQVWRLMTETEGLWARLMRAWYYPGGNVMSAVLGNHLSYVWRGILEARELLRGGWRRRIGDGLTTKV
ncbi:putative mitochondrial protein AtMg00310 [Silene latifolia]|uniref:putative mitochondrial protein AtMg00310 n=1 Tax=Silene latifolia TaxID=37657 RepID=UPI003D77B1C4